MRLLTLVRHAKSSWKDPDLTESSWDKMMVLNMRTPFITSTRTDTSYKEGHIVNIGSTEKTGATPDYAAYYDSKAGLHGFTYTLEWPPARKASTTTPSRWAGLTSI